MVNEAFIRRVALALPGAYEHASHDGQPSFRTKPRMFCWIRAEPRALVVWVESLDAKQALLATQPEVFFTTPHYDGYAMLLVNMSAVSQKQARDVIEESWKLRAPRTLVKARASKRA
ncbi:MAG TPA: MmcQ/YjbR family DNA-binding protein [Polyangiales bacterium]|nr:MmcQ/YjbR family DNA-binding protein [Polyangiales bacterium]